LTQGESMTGVVGTAAEKWLAQLSDEQRSTAMWAFDARERGNWHYAPRKRNGLPLRAMSDEQRGAAHALLRASLSDQGANKAMSIMALEDVLRVLEGSSGTHRDPLNYAITVFGDTRHPPWGWRIEGHHLVLNITVASSGNASITPNFWGANPARFPPGERAGERVLESEYLVALELARSLTAGQRREAVFASSSVGNIISERGRGLALRHPSGLSCADLSDQQSLRLTTLLGAYLDNMPPEVAAQYRDLAVREPRALHLAWAGGMAEGEAFYYRLHGPRLLIEFDCTADDANHIHSLWRDPVNDWGRDILGEHYRHHHDQD
jgi:hypothetical protein